MLGCKGTPQRASLQGRNALKITFGCCFAAAASAESANMSKRMLLLAFYQLATRDNLREILALGSRADGYIRYSTEKPHSRSKPSAGLIDREPPPTTVSSWCAQPGEDLARSEGEI